ncbi:MAG: hypothetical protein AB1762_06095 [Gemmatimonadota bacterium]
MNRKRAVELGNRQGLLVNAVEPEMEPDVIVQGPVGATKLCHMCKSSIDAEAHKCPNCHTHQLTGMTFFAFVISVIIVVFMVSICMLPIRGCIESIVKFQAGLP